jgi:peptidylprolyl isomerase
VGYAPGHRKIIAMTATSTRSSLTSSAALAALLLGSLGSCGGDSAPAPGSSAASDAAAGGAGAVVPRTVDKGDGLTVDIQEEGTGALAANGRWLKVHYRGRLRDGGQEFESSFKTGVPYTLQLGAPGVIAGWQRGLDGLREGAKAVLHVPAALAYGSAGLPGLIPPDADLDFDVQVVEVR